MIKLLHCPFCGSTEVSAEISYVTKEFRIYCANPEANCSAEMRLSFADAGLGDGEIIDFGEMTSIIQQLMDLWNTRPSKEAEKRGRWIYDEEEKGYTCSECGMSALNDDKGVSVASNGCPHCLTRMDI